ncbi:ABC transporter permease [Salegentibacter sp. JZCK2]|uniref:ABC transporter permease n=1 Tax=Salegentibacter tibetensis TaxID=2873600 RepID=UPI001CCF0673|nr:ABC transporter permease [Salegentibacter tibetensis]MBZ9731142.1 ABC transporter permease [Salegentibacter tibetensis]
MIKNYIKTAWRNLLKNKVYSILNILGLAISLACFILIALYVVDELSYDRFHEKAERIYRINSDITMGESQSLPFTSDMMGPTMKQDYPQVEEFVRIYTSNGSKLLRKGNEFIQENRVAHADSTIFEVFTLPLIAGDPDTALKDPRSVVISESAAQKYFSSVDVLGETLETIQGTEYKITGLMQDIPSNSHFRFDFLFSMDNDIYRFGNHISHNFHTYLLLREGTTAQEIEAKFNDYMDRYVMPVAKQVLNINSRKEFEDAGNKLEYSLFPITRIHLYSDRVMEIRPGGDIQYVYIFSAVALFILLIACINFMNLSTARSAGRAREVGIRKVLGSARKQLIQQFLSEAMLMAALAMFLAVGITYLSLPAFNEIAAKTLSIQRIFQPDILVFLLVLPFLVGLLAGSYPALFLSGFKPVQVLKGNLNLGAKGGTFRNVLVVFQFATSIILIIGTIVVYQQLDYIQNKNLGFNKEQVIVVNETHVLGQQAPTFKNEVLEMTGIKNGTLSGYLPVSGSSRSDNTFSKEAVMSTESSFGMQQWIIDEDYIPTMGMELVQGRNFSKKFSTDSTAVILNESAAKIFGPGDVVGKKIYRVSNFETGELTSYEIIGVVKNFHFETLRQNIGPLGFMLGNSTGLASFKVNAANISQVLIGIEQKWESMSTGMPFSYRFMDEAFDEMYRTEQRLGKIALIFSLLAILVACLGLFGLSTFIAEKRIKEIGIRKILGASVNGLVQMLSKDFLKLVIIAFVVATPLAWYAMNQWLQDFVYRIEISWLYFAAAGFLALSIALATVSYHAVKAAMMNPAKNLRSE